MALIAATFFVLHFICFFNGPTMHLVRRTGKLLNQMTTHKKSNDGSRLKIVSLCQMELFMSVSPVLIVFWQISPNKFFLRPTKPG